MLPDSRHFKYKPRNGPLQSLFSSVRMLHGQKCLSGKECIVSDKLAYRIRSSQGFGVLRTVVRARVGPACLLARGGATAPQLELRVDTEGGRYGEPSQKSGD